MTSPPRTGNERGRASPASACWVPCLRQRAVRTRRAASARAPPRALLRRGKEPGWTPRSRRGPPDRALRRALAWPPAAPPRHRAGEQAPHRRRTVGEEEEDRPAQGEPEAGPERARQPLQPAPSG